MKITIAIQCDNFEKRLCWMLSSIKQQYILNPVTFPKIVIDIAYLEQDKPLRTIEVIRFFRDRGLDITTSKYKRHKHIFERRGLVRNRQLKEAMGEWILFADSDMVYPPDYFQKLGDILYRDSSNPHCLHSARQSTYLEDTNALIDAYTYPTEIVNAFTLAEALPSKIKSNIGAGYCQIANISLIKESDAPYYVPDNCRKDSPMFTMQKARTDAIFRRRLGREKIDLPRQVHLQHVRDKEVGYHSLEQR